MKVGDMVKFAETVAHHRGPNAVGIVTAMLPRNEVLETAVSVLWSSGDIVERMNPTILEVINEGR